MAYWSTGDTITADKLNAMLAFVRVEGYYNNEDAQCIDATEETIQEIFNNGQLPLVFWVDGTEGSYTYWNDIIIGYNHVSNTLTGLNTISGEGQCTYVYDTDHYVLTSPK